MARRAFYSFHYEPDNSRAAQVRNMGMVDGNTPVADNDWETITKGGDAAIKKWICQSDARAFLYSCFRSAAGQRGESG